MTFGATYTLRMRDGLVPYGVVLGYAVSEMRYGTKDLFIPVRIVDALHVVQRPDLFTRVAAPTECCIKLLDNHVAFYRWAQENGLSKFLPGEVKSYPCIVKDSCGGYGGQSVRICSTAEEKDRALASSFHLGVEAVAQEMVPGTDEYVGHYLVKGGKVLEHGVRRVKLPTAYSKKQDPQAGTPVEVDDSPIVEIFHRLNYSGFACANFKLRDSGRIALFEINPRIGESLCFPANRPLLERMLARLPDTF